MAKQSQKQKNKTYICKLKLHIYIIPIIGTAYLADVSLFITILLLETVAKNEFQSSPFRVNSLYGLLLYQCKIEGRTLILENIF